MAIFFNMAIFLIIKIGSKHPKQGNGKFVVHDIIGEQPLKIVYEEFLKTWKNQLSEMMRYKMVYTIYKCMNVCFHIAFSTKI